MFNFKIKYSFFLLFITLAFLNSCNSTQNIKTKLTDKNVMSKNKYISVDKIIKNNNTKIPQNNTLKVDSKITKKTLNLLSNPKSNNMNENEVTFEFRNERLLQGRDAKIKKVNKKTKTALTAVFKMLKKNPSLESKNLNLNDTIINKNSINYSLNFYKNSNVFDTNNILVFLPFTGAYSKFGIKIRQAIDLSILSFGFNKIKIIYFDTGAKYSLQEVKKLVEEINPKIILGPFTSTSVKKLKAYVKEKNIPMFAFTNNIDVIEKNIWLLGFSPEEQVDSVLSCSLLKNHRKFGIIVPNNFYGKVILERSSDIINSHKDTSIKKLTLSNFEMSNKSKLATILKRFLAYNSENKVNNSSKFRN